MQSLDALNLIPVWVNPEHMAATARILLAGHRLKVLAVLDGVELVGIVTEAQLKNEPDEATVGTLMQRPEIVVDAAIPLRELAETFWKNDIEFIPVMQGNKFRGVATPNMLLKEMARSWDPLTGLSWSDRLREWGVDNLKLGREITILFIDLDDFGSYNKKYGHIVGDRVLQKVSDMIGDRIDRTRDQLVRYGGDEFAVGTIRNQADSLELAKSLHEGMSRLRVAGSDEPVTFSIGVQGGKRTKERENVHYAATLDNLINLASKNSMAEKAVKLEEGSVVRPPESEGMAHVEISAETAVGLADAPGESGQISNGSQPEMEREPEGAAVSADSGAPAHAVVEESPHREFDGPMTVEDVVADAADANSVTQVTIRMEARSFTGVCPRKGGSVVKSVALATARAVSEASPDTRIEIREVNLTESDAGVRFISVLGTIEVDGRDRPIGGVGAVGRNLYFTVAEATLQAYTNFKTLQGESK